MKAFALYSGNAEPSIDELLGDPVIQTMMVRDGVALREIRALIATAQRRQCSTAVTEAWDWHHRALEAIRL